MSDHSDDHTDPDDNTDPEDHTDPNDPRYPIPNPGHPEHLPRLTDVDPRAADRATRQVATFFGLVPVLAISFVVVYFAVPNQWYVDFGFLHTNAKNLLLGLSFGLALLFIGMGAVQWARTLMDDHELVDYRHGATSSPEDVEYMLVEMDKVVDESKITRRKVIGRSLLGALGAVLLPMVVGLADLGPWPTKKKRQETIETTIWAEGIRLVHDITFEPIKASEMVVGHGPRSASPTIIGSTTAPSAPSRLRPMTLRRVIFDSSTTLSISSSM